MNTPSNTPSINARELFRLASLIGCEPEDEARHRADLKAFVDQYVSERIKSEAAKYCDDGHYHDKERDIAMLPSEHLKELHED